MRPSRIAMLAIGCLLVIPALALLFGGSALGLGLAFGRDDDGYVATTIDRLASNTVAVTAQDITFAADPGSPDWVLDALAADVRLQATDTSSEQDLFIGIGRQADVDAYLAGVAHDEVVELTDGLEPVYRRHEGSSTIAPPVDQDFWAATTTGPGDRELAWNTTSGSWSAVLMNANGSPGVIADVEVGAKAAFVLPLVFIMLGTGALVAALAVGLIIAGARGIHRDDATTATSTSIEPAEVRHLEPHAAHPVSLNARLDPELSRWKWLVKWLLAIPHLIVLAFLMVAFALLTLVAAVFIVFTGRYPRTIFDFNVGVLRWSWRVTYYATSGGIGTDRYPPFSLRPQPGDAADLDVDYPERLSRGLVFVKWFLAIPHLIIVAILSGGSLQWLTTEGSRIDGTGSSGLLGLLVFIAGVVLLFTGRYPHALFDLIVGLNRWIYRTIAYVALMTDVYPPFRLDQGGSEPPTQPLSPAPPSSTDAVDLRIESTGTPTESPDHEGVAPLLP